MKFRKFQVRQHGGRFPEFKFKEDKVYSVVMYIDEPTGSKVYEHKTLINLSYEDAYNKALEFENSKILPNMNDWIELDSV